MLAFSTTELSRKVGDIIAAALRAPVTLTQHNKPRLVLLSVEEYERLTSNQATPMHGAGLLRDMPEALAADFRTAALAYIESE